MPSLSTNKRTRLVRVHRTKSVRIPASGRPCGRPSVWSGEQVGNWIRSLDLNAGDIEQYIELFARHEISGAELVSLQKPQLTVILGLSTPSTIVNYFDRKLFTLRMVERFISDIQGTV